MTTDTPTVTDELIELNGLRFHFRDWPGTIPDARPLILLHGITQNARGWDPIARALAADFRVIAFDQRGHGESQWAPPGQYRIEDFTADFEAFVTALALQRLVVVGHSMGGAVGYHYASKQPAPLERLVIVDMAPEVPEEGLAFVRALLQAPNVFDSPEQVLARLLQLQPNADPERARHRVVTNLMRTADGKWTRRWDRAMRDPAFVLPVGAEDAEAWAVLPRINVPTLVMRGETSTIVPREAADRMVREIPGAAFAEIAGAGHAIYADQHAAFLETVRGFLLPN